MKISALSLFLHLLAVVASSPSALAEAPSKADFTWSPNVGEYVSHGRVTFANGAEIRTFRSDGTPQFGCEFSGVAAKTATSNSFYGTGPCDAIAHINVAWPSTTNAKVAIASTNCGGTICHTYSDYYVFLINGSSVKVLQVGTGHAGPSGKPTKFTFTFSGNDATSSVITNFYSGEENNLGDLLSSRRTLLKGKGYVHDSFRPQYIDLVGEHPERFLENESLRASMVTKTGPANFRALRASLSGPGSSSLLNGRFVLMEACQKHNCDSTWGAVVVDGFTGDAAAVVLRNGSKTVDQYSTRALKDDIDHAWVERIYAGEGGYVSLNKGIIKVSR
jgi:hypothetical protein